MPRVFERRGRDAGLMAGTEAATAGRRGGVEIAMIVAADLPAAVGNTPLIRLRRASEATGCEIWGKAEFMNPGASASEIR